MIGGLDVNRTLRAQLIRAPAFAGWAPAWTDRQLAASGVNNAVCFGETSDRMFTGLRFGANSFGALRSYIKATGAWETHLTPAAVLGVAAIEVIGADLLYIGTILAGTPILYAFVPSTGVFTDTVWPGGAADQIQSLKRGVADPDALYVGNQATAAAGSAQLWRLSLSTGVWTKLGAGAPAPAGWVLGAPNGGIESIGEQGRMWVMAAGGGANFLEVWRSTPTVSAWSRNAGAGVNGSWPTGTMRGGRLLTAGASTLYATTGGTTAGDAGLWRLIGAGAWSRIGGAGAGWSGYTAAGPIAARGDYLVVGLGNTTAGEAVVYQYKISTGVWEQIGGDGIRGSWPPGAIKQVEGLTIAADGTLWAAVNSWATGTAQVWSLAPA